MNNPHIKIEAKGNGLADVSGIVDCDDAILFCRVTCDMMTSPMAYNDRQKFLSEMFVSVLRKTCKFREALEVICNTADLLNQNREMLGHD